MANSPINPGSTERTVLLVDDEPNVVESLKHVLRKEGYRILTAGSGEEGLERVRSAKVDIIVMDERMPGLQGSEALAIIAEEQPATLRILLTGHASLQAAITAINEGRIYRFLEKPIPPQDFRRVIAEGFLQLEKTALSLDLAERMRQDPEFRQRLTSEYAPDPPAGAKDLPLEKLSPKEADVFRLASQGFNIAQMAIRFGRSPETIRNQLKSVYRKLGLHSQSELIERVRPIEIPKTRSAANPKARPRFPAQ